MRIFFALAAAVALAGAIAAGTTTARSKAAEAAGLGEIMALQQMRHAKRPTGLPYSNQSFAPAPG